MKKQNTNQKYSLWFYLASYDEKAILAFIEANRNKSPEPLAQ